jgi:hypothetical protein
MKLNPMNALMRPFTSTGVRFVEQVVVLFGRDRHVERVVVHIHLGGEQEPLGHPELGDVQARVAGGTGVDGNHLGTAIPRP